MGDSEVIFQSLAFINRLSIQMPTNISQVGYATDPKYWARTSQENAMCSLKAMQPRV